MGWWGLGHHEGSSWGLLGGCTQGSKHRDVLAVGYPRADRDWGQGSVRVGNGTVVGQRGHHRHDDDDDIIVTFVIDEGGRPWGCSVGTGR